MRLCRGRLHRNRADQRVGDTAQPGIGRPAGERDLVRGRDPHRVPRRQFREDVLQRIEIRGENDDRMSRARALGSRHAVHAAQPLAEPRQQFIARPDKLPASRDHVNSGQDKQADRGKPVKEPDNGYLTAPSIRTASA